MIVSSIFCVLVYRAFKNLYVHFIIHLFDGHVHAAIMVKLTKRRIWNSEPLRWNEFFGNSTV